MAVTLTQAEFIEYLPAVKFTIGGTDYTLPIWNLQLNVIPWSGIGSAEQKHPDGTTYQYIRKWNIQAEFDASLPHDGTDTCSLRSLLNDFFETGEGTLDFDPVDNVGVRTLTVVIDDATAAAAANFAGHVRNRPYRLSVITKEPIATAAIPTWIAGNS